LVTEITNKRLNIFIIASLSIAVIVLTLKLSNVFSPDSDKQYVIAVLPFDDMSQGKDNEWFCDGVAESILTNLSKVKGLTVISRTSVKQYKDHKTTIPEIAKQLGADYILEGSVRKDNNKVLITAQLISANDKHLWADDYNRKLEDIFEIQEDVSKQIVAQLNMVISPEEEESIKNSSTTNVEAYQKYLKGRNIINAITIGNSESERIAYEKSIDYYKEAILIDPNYADAYAEMANSYFFLYFISSGVDEFLQQAKYFNDQALAINPNTSQVYNNLALIYKYIDGDDINFEINIKKALELDPNNATAHMEYATHYKFEDFYDGEKMLIHINKGNLLDPLSNEIKVEIKGLLDALKNKDQTLQLRALEQALEKESDNANLHRSISWVYHAILNDEVSFLKHARKAFELDSTSEKAANYLFALYYNERFKTAKQVLDNPKIFEKFDDLHKCMNLLDYYAYKGDYANALVYLEKLKPLREYRYYIEKTWLNSKMGNVEIVYNAFEEYDGLTDVTKAICFANLGQKDSMYLYVDKISNTKNPERRYQNVLKINSDQSFDNYRNEPRFIDFLKQHFLPVKKVSM
jgi:TolB-like protein/Tfp pilus assembly protein PilF